MIRKILLPVTLLPLALSAASCGAAATGDSSTIAGSPQLQSQVYGTFQEPWAAAFIPGTPMLFITEKAGTAQVADTSSPSARPVSVSGLPAVDYGGQGGLGDVAFLPSATATGPNTIFLSWAEAGEGNTRGAALGRGTLTCIAGSSCNITNLKVIWRQTPKVSGRGHYSHRIAIAPDASALFIASGERQKMQPAQDQASDLGKIIRIPIDEAGNPTGPAEHYSMGHRNILGLHFDQAGQLWDLEHGPAGGDELNLVEAGANYGWPIVSEGDHYDGKAIPRHSSRPDFHAPVISWNPVIAPGDFLFYRGTLFPGWQGDAIIAGLKTEALIRVKIDGASASEVGRYPMDRRIREIAEGADGALWVLEDGKDGRLIRLTVR